jgi:ferric iron reductase protein FhuF
MVSESGVDMGVVAASVPCSAQGVPLSALQGIWQGELAAWQSVLCAEVEAGVPLFIPEQGDEALADLLLCYARQQHAGLAPVAAWADWSLSQREALASEWGRSLFYRLSVPALSVLVLVGRALPLLPLRLRLSAELTVDGVVVADGGVPQRMLWSSSASINTEAQTPDEASLTIATLSLWLEQGLGPLIQQLERVTGCRSRVLWCTLASYWRWWLHSEALTQRLSGLTAEERPLAEGRRQAALRFIEQPELPVSTCYQPLKLLELPRNPLFQPLRLRTAAGQPIWVRRICCQRYQLPGLAVCSYCPLLQAPASRPTGVCL